jgi:hypothetical protein
MSQCFCRALVDLSVLSDDTHEETRLRQTPFGIEVQRWRLASTVFIPDDTAGGSPACDASGFTGAIPHTVRDDQSTLEIISPRPIPASGRDHEQAR